MKTARGEQLNCGSCACGLQRRLGACGVSCQVGPAGQFSSQRISNITVIRVVISSTVPGRRHLRQRGLGGFRCGVGPATMQRIALLLAAPGQDSRAHIIRDGSQAMHTCSHKNPWHHHLGPGQANTLHHLWTMTCVNVPQGWALNQVHRPLCGSACRRAVADTTIVRVA